MAGIMDKVKDLANSPKGQQAIAKTKQAVNDPKNRDKVNSMLSKVQGKGRGRGSASR